MNETVDKEQGKVAPHINLKKRKELVILTEPAVSTHTNLSSSSGGIAGLELIENFLSKEEENDLMERFGRDCALWSSELKRRVIHFGYKYDYKTRRTAQQPTTEIPQELLSVIGRIQSSTQLPLPEAFDQCIVNEYEPGQGIGGHIDSSTFADGIVSVSIGSGIVMQFTGPDEQQIDVWLPRRSALVLTGEARYKWRHGIAAVKTNSGGRGKRMRRVSFTFRKLFETPVLEK